MEGKREVQKNLQKSLLLVLIEGVSPSNPIDHGES